MESVQSHSSSLKSRHQRRLCGHCNEVLSYSAYRSHRALYYVEAEKRWLSVQTEKQCDESNRLSSTDDSSSHEMEFDTGDSPVVLDTKDDYDDQEPLREQQFLDDESDEDTDLEEKELGVIIEDSTDSEDDLDTADSTASRSASANKIITLVIAFLMKFRVLYNVSDRAIVLLLRFFKYFLSIIGNTFALPDLIGASGTQFPQTLHGSYSFLGLNATPYKQYIACPSCHLLYDPSTENLVVGTESRPESAKCSFIEFPHHPQQRFRMPCNTILMNKVQRRDRISFKARKVYLYYGLIASLSNLLNRPDFLRICNHCFQGKKPPDILTDITCGIVWNDIVSSLSPDKQPINILGLLINIDWFQPHKHISYSVGVIYAVVINLPRNIRYKVENVIIIGIIPGPCEPKKHINSYLGPLVSELLLLYSGQWFSTCVGKQFIQCVMVCLSSDIPATRKAAGFVGHNALKACSRCLKTFPRVGNSCDCSGFDRKSWPLRTHAVHFEQAYKCLNAQTKVERKRIEQEYGVRYSVFFELPYYNAIHFAAIDPMHNLFLGTAKHLMTLWKDRDILSKSHFFTIEERIQKINVPLDVGRIPYKIESGLSSLTADQWKMWTCVYSLYVLSGILPEDHLHCWWLFVQACLVICQPILTHAAIEKADKWFMEFCKAVESLYGPQSCTINLHLHCHLAECLRDYGPVHATWCFSFERYNGILGGTPNNNHSLEVEKTMMNRFVQQAQNNFPNLSELDSFFPVTAVGSVSDTHVNSEVYIKQWQLSNTTDLSELIFCNDLAVRIGQLSEHALQSYEVLCLSQMYQEIFPGCKLIHVSRLCHRFYRAKFCNKLLSSQMAKSDRSSYVCANWLNNSSPDQFRPGQVRFFFKHNVVIEKQNKERVCLQPLLAFIEWYSPHEENKYFPSPVTVWNPKIEPVSSASFMPINRIAYRCAQAHTHMEFSERPYNNGQAIIIIPIDGIHIVT